MAAVVEDGIPVTGFQQHTAKARSREHQGDSEPVNIGGAGNYNPEVGRRYWVTTSNVNMILQCYNGAAWFNVGTGGNQGNQWNFYQQYDATVPEAGAYRVNNAGAAAWIAVSWEIEK